MGRQKDCDLHMPPNPLGALCFSGVPERCRDQAVVCMTMTPQRHLPYSATVQDQRLGSSLIFDMIFPIFCSIMKGKVWKQALCIFEGLVHSSVPLTNGPVSSDSCCPRLPQREDAEGKMAAVFEPKAFTSVYGLQMLHEKRRKTMSVYSTYQWFLHMTSSLCSLYMGAYISVSFLFL